MRFELEEVRYMPATIEAGILYVSREFDIAIHLCACGCGSKVRTPLGPTEWQLDQTATGPSLHPSIGNWQEVCQSHYWIYRGEVRWAESWSPEQIAAGRDREQQRREGNHPARSKSFWKRFVDWLKTLLRR